MKKLLTTILLLVFLTGCSTGISGVEESVGSIDIFNPVTIEGWKHGLMTSPEFDGADMPASALVQADNVEFDVKNSIAPRRGTLILGNSSASTTPVQSLHASKALDGREVLIRTASTKIEWYNKDGDNWEVLDNGYTTGLEFSFVDGMISTDSAVYTYFSNGVNQLNRFRVGFGSILSNSSTAITLNPVTGFDSADDLGFSTTTNVTINGTEYSWTTINGWEMSGFTGLPTFTVNEGIIHAPGSVGVFNFPTGVIAPVAMVIKDQRLYAAYKNSVHCSKIDDFTNFTFTTPRVAGEGEIVIFPEGGKQIDALAVRPDYVAVFKKDYIGSLAFKDFGDGLSDLPVLNTVDMEPNIGASSQKAVDNKSNAVVYSNRRLGISELTRVSQATTDSVSEITLRIKPTIEDYDFSDSAIIYFDNKVLNATRDNEDFNNAIVVYDTTYNRLTEFTGINASVFEVYNDKLYYGDSITQNVYQMFYSEYTDNTLPYISESKTKWFNFDSPANWKEIGQIFVSGWITANTDIDLTVYLDESGKLTSATYTIEGDGDYVSVDSGSSFASNPFGLTNFSNVEGSSDNLKHFAGFINTDDLFKYKFRNIQAGFKTSGTDQNFRIDKLIFYANVLPREYGQDEILINSN